ncbi:TetR/AcrR family transcriptional regulator [Tessaracoccus sp. OS52]|uniref:TetR/AcrR family transcriptional regulator n=1 Tax=Tessaracoccus sp. OS52 TaxID=2886691 RepID=UPI001D1221E8|nr:TetR/AcrR family transcriptional regulator [Tessaracoccus sp. OS52]MCC2593664.1 TetR/AcrR family transcriptional regulator [Tessaracoccus sp. OS52]
MTETTPRREATRLRLIEAGIHEFATRGIDATSVEQLCEAAGFSRGAFYSNFSTKDDLCIAILEHHRDMVVEGLTRVYAEPPAEGGVSWATGTALQTYFRIIAPTDEFRVTLMEIRLRTTRVPELAARARDLHDDVRPVMVSFIDQLAAALGLRFTIPTEDLLQVFDALYFSELNLPAEQRTGHLIGQVAVALSRPIGDGNG